MRLSFIWYWNRASETYPHYRDGLRAALEEIAKEHTVDWYFDEKIPEDTYDACLIWGDSNCPAIEKVATYKSRKGIILTTDPHSIDNLRNLDVVYCESEPIYNAVRKHGIRAIRAFGTDTAFFTPDDTKKDIEYFYPATFSPWKTQSSIAHLGNKLTCIGTVQPDGAMEYAACIDNGVNVEVGYFPVEKIRDYYRRSQRVIVPSIHGSERTVLEAMSCGIKPEVNEGNVRAFSYLKELEESGLSPREFVLKNYNPELYAKNILRGFL